MDTPVAERLRLTEIFLSVQGESRSVGWPTVSSVARSVTRTSKTRVVVPGT